MFKKVTKQPVETDLPEVPEEFKHSPLSVVSLMEQVLDKRRKPRPRYFRPSMVFGCDRQNVYHYNQAPEGPPDIDNRLHRILDTGTAVHKMLQDYLAEHPGIFFAPETKVEAYLGPRKALVMGSCDGLVTRRSDKFSLLIEIKTINPAGFDKLRSAKPEHIKQAMVYAKLQGVHFMAFLYFCKGTQSIKEYVVPVDEKLWAEFVERLTMLKGHVDAGTLPLYNKQTCSKSFCRMVGQCRKDGAPV